VAVGAGRWRTGGAAMNPDTSQQAVAEAARVLLERMGLVLLQN
jgi:hypothetical protein